MYRLMWCVGLLASVCAPEGAAQSSMNTLDPAGNASTCFDAVLVARVLSQKPTPLPQAEPDIIIMRWPWKLTVEPEEVLYAGVPIPTRRFEVETIQHTYLRDEIDHFLLFLRRSKTGFRVRWIDLQVTRDQKGRFVRPIAESADEVTTFPDFWIPHDYVTRQVPIRYRTRAAWWHRETYDNDDNPIPLSSKPKWTEEQGLMLKSLRSVIAEQAIQRCETGAEELHPLALD